MGRYTKLVGGDGSDRRMFKWFIFAIVWMIIFGALWTSVNNRGGITPSPNADVVQQFLTMGYHVECPGTAATCSYVANLNPGVVMLGGFILIIMIGVIFSYRK